MLKIIAPIAFAVITISASTNDGINTNGLQRRLLGDKDNSGDDKYKPDIGIIWKNDKKDEDKKDDKYVDDYHRYPRYKSSSYHNDKSKSKDSGYYEVDYKKNNHDNQYLSRPNKYEQDYGYNKDHNDYYRADRSYSKSQDKHVKYNDVDEYEPYHHDKDRSYSKSQDRSHHNYKYGYGDGYYSPSNYKVDYHNNQYGDNKNNNDGYYNHDNYKVDYNNNQYGYEDNKHDYQPQYRTSGWDNNYDHGNQYPKTNIKEAIVYLNVGDGSGVEGYVKFEDIDGKKTKISAKITGLPPKSQHGWHVHQFGDLFTDGCASLGPHYNPFDKNHGAPDDDERHVGDLGNIYSDKDGVAYIEAQYDELVKLNGPTSIIGRGFVIHGDKDDLGRGGNDDSLQTGNAGARVACGVIGIKKED